jgi:protoheme IX farnesyltransferase
MSVGVATGATGVTMLASLVNPVTAALGAFNIVLYAGVYTPMKRTHVANTVMLS